MAHQLLFGPCLREAGNPVVSDDGDSELDAGRESAEADCDALDLAYRLLNVHTHLLVVVDPRGIRDAGPCVMKWVDARRTPPTVGCRTLGRSEMCRTQLAHGGQCPRRESCET